MLRTVKEVTDLILNGKYLHIAGDERLLAKLPKGNWIGGTTPYFMAKEGGQVNEEKLFVQTFPMAREVSIKHYTSSNVNEVVDDAYDNGFTILTLPFGSQIVEAYAKKAPEMPDLYMKNIAGWITGVNLGNENAPTAKVVDGKSLVAYDNHGLAMHVKLEDDTLASLGMVNIFEIDDDQPTITFEDDAFCASDCKIDGEPWVLADYLEKKGVDTQLPLIADYSGSNINVSIKGVEKDKVNFYAPVFKNREYHFAKPVDNYATKFKDVIEHVNGDNVIFSCNCILNYLYGELEGEITDPYYGQVTFGEIAYQLVNQTLVYIDIH